MHRDARKARHETRLPPAEGALDVIQPLLTGLLPPGVCWVERAVERALRRADGEPVAAEAALMAGMHPARRMTFVAGRVCARAALDALGRPIDALGRLENGAPDWPDGVVGSISHCPDRVAAAVAPASDFAALGIDVEHTGRVSLAIAQRVCTPVESRALASAEAASAGLAAVIFSAKESVFKAAWVAETGAPRVLADIEIEIVQAATDAEPGVFVARPSDEAGTFSIETDDCDGRYVQIGGFTATTVAWRRREHSAIGRP